jgi:hypothetical protein
LRWREDNPEDSLRFYALRLHEAGDVTTKLLYGFRLFNLLNLKNVGIKPLGGVYARIKHYRASGECNLRGESYFHRKLVLWQWIKKVLLSFY